MQNFKTCLCFQVSRALFLFCALLHSCGMSSFSAGSRQGRSWESGSKGGEGAVDVGRWDLGNTFQDLEGPARCQAVPGKGAFESWHSVGMDSSLDGGLTWVAVESGFQSCPWNVNFSMRLLENSRHQRIRTRSQLKKPKLLPVQ